MQSLVLVSLILGGSAAERQEEVVSRVCRTNSVSAWTSLGNTKTGTLSSRPMMYVGHTIICVPQEGGTEQLARHDCSRDG